MPEKCIKDHVASAEASVAHQPPNQTKLTKMKSMILVALALVAVAAALPVEQPVEPLIAILRSNYDQSPEGGYNYGYETENGIARQEIGELRTVPDEDNKPHEVVVVRGSYNYPGEDGKPISVEYFADETGFHAVGDSIPKPARR